MFRPSTATSSTGDHSGNSSVSVHDCPKLLDPEKLVYLQHSLKNSSAKRVIEGLSRSGEHYAEAIECLKARYDRPWLIHPTHVHMIIEAQPLKDGSGKELCRLHDTVQQHLHALKAMEYEPSDPIITSVLELKLDMNTLNGSVTAKMTVPSTLPEVP